MTRALLAFLLACPVFGQIQVSCPAPGTSATVTVVDPQHPNIFVRIEPAADGHTMPLKFPAPGFDIATMQAGPVQSGVSATLATTPGKWLAYYFQDSPYVQGSSKPFECISGPPTPPPAIPPVACLRVLRNGVAITGCLSVIDLVECPGRQECSQAEVIDPTSTKITILVPKQ